MGYKPIQIKKSLLLSHCISKARTTRRRSSPLRRLTREFDPAKECYSTDSDYRKEIALISACHQFPSAQPERRS
jgi:hypothetical protein